MCWEQVCLIHSFPVHEIELSVRPELMTELSHFLFGQQACVQVGPSSVANHLETEALCFGGSHCTGTDIAIASGIAPASICGSVDGKVKVERLGAAMVYAAMREMHQKLEAVIDSVKVYDYCSQYNPFYHHSLPPSLPHSSGGERGCASSPGGRWEHPHRPTGSNQRCLQARHSRELWGELT